MDRHARKRDNGYLNDITDVLTSFMDFCIFGRCSRRSVCSLGDIARSQKFNV